MKSQSFWNSEYEKIRQVDSALSRTPHLRRDFLMSWLASELT
jgi:hypothetical protein